ncbi:MAG: transporter substrate-binding domain-containing protein [Anaerolineae bacterium]|nr:transporter substrate-binding domain-containing protein [Anaerolineae bacterium]
MALFLLLAASMPGFAQEPAPTLVPPTPVPTQPTDAPVLASHSGIATMQQEGILRVGARYNMFPFSYLDDSGKLTGYEVELVRAIATELGVQVEFIQVTGENELEELLTGRVDALVGEQIITRPAEQFVEFTHPHYLNKQTMVVRFDSPYQTLQDLNGKAVAVVKISRGETATQWMITHEKAIRDPNFNYDLRPYYTEKEALDALERGEVEAVVGELDNLTRAGRQGMRLIEQPVQLDPYAIAVRRYDVNLRNALNRSVQRLFASGSLTGLYIQWFQDKNQDQARDYFNVLLPVYENVLEDARTLQDFPPDVPLPQTSIVDRITTGEPLTVAGLSLSTDANAVDNMLDPFNKAIMDELARRWGVTVNYIPGTATNGVDYMVNGQAMIAVGVTPRWDGADRFDYSRPYASHGERLMVLEGSRFGGFGDFRGGTYIGFWYEDENDRARIEQIAEALRVRPTVYEFRSTSEIVDMFGDRTVEGLFGDTLRLFAIQKATQNSGLPFKILAEQYSYVPLAIALPRNDAKFRSLLDWTLQDMFLDGTYQRIYNETFGFGEPLVMLTWPGDGSFLMD